MKDVWEKRNLIKSFAISDLKLRYRGSVLGFFWTLLEPLLILSILNFVFTNLWKSQIENYVIYLLLGLVMWNFFTRSTSMAMNSFFTKRGIITKTYIPREILPTSSCFTALLMTIFEFAVVVIFLIAYNFVPPITIIILPALIVLEFILALGASLFLSVLNVKYRDISHIWAVVTYAGFFASPIMYKLDMLPENIQNILLYSPMAQIIEMTHQVVVFGIVPDLGGVIYTVGFSFILLIAGFFVFKKLSPKVIEVL